LIRPYQRAIVAFSGGCDSAFVLKVSRGVLGRENVRAVIAKSPSLPETELEEARQIAREVDAPLVEIETHELDNPMYASNPINRCYFCKSELYADLVGLAKAWGFGVVFNGVHQGDLGDWRPGLAAAAEFGVKSPLIEAGFTKEEIRFFSRELGLSVWSKPQAACLSSRIPFGARVTRERLKQVEEGEAILKGLGFKVVRLRWQEKKATLEVGSQETKFFFENPALRSSILKGLKELGFQTVEICLEGYRTGRFNPREP